MPLKNPEERRAYNKKYRQENKDRIAIKMKLYRQENKEILAVQMKKYKKENKERIAIQEKKYREENPEKSHETETKYNWKRKGLLCEDVHSLYCHYLDAKNCDECGCVFGKKGDGTGTFKCMDHSHITGEFRNFLCHSCNLRRGEYNL
tara:strand:+ start:150 stop:593 length:444 start_codon:yes stop_codon:yes gene_type:complete